MVKKTLDRVESEVPEFLTHLESNFGPDDVVRVSSEPGCTGMEKMVSYATTCMTFYSNGPLCFQMSTWWRKACCGLAVIVLWISKHRSGVVSDMTTGEWLARKREADKVVVTVAKHKTGDKQPALVVLPLNIDRLMER